MVDTGQQTLTIQQTLDLALQHHRAGRLSRAESIYQQVLQSNPNQVDALHLLGAMAHQVGKNDTAVELITKALAIKPDYAEASNNLGLALQELEKSDEAVASYHKALTINPNFAEAWNNLGTAQQDQQQLIDATASYRKAISIKPDYAQAHYNLGTAFEDLRNLGEAMTSYRNALAIDQNFADAHENMAYALLMQGKLKEGWQEYAWRLKTKACEKPILPIEIWPGSSLQGKSIIVYAEQGVGDEIMFSSCIPDLLKQSSDKLFLTCDPRLEALFSRSFPGVLVQGKMRDIDLSWPREHVLPDYSLPTGSLPKFFRNKLEDFPDRLSYLIADSQQRQALRKRYLERGNDVLVGIAWYSNSARYGERKSMTLDDLRPLLEMPGITFIDLQYGDTIEERKAFTAENGVEVFHDDDVDQMNDLDIFASQLAAMDVVVTISNTTAHMAGALGIPTLLMLGSVPIWYWLFKRDDSPWYPSLRLIRQQKTGGDWHEVVEQARNELAAHVGDC
jgi:Flp pilus assembly protein TadD